MKYSMGDSLADYGFSFFEKLHSPIFLLHKSGSLKKVNEAGRKLLSVAHINRRELDSMIKAWLKLDRNCQIFGSKQKKIKLVSKQLDCSDYLLVELIR